jgi:hypothetical protein
MKLRIKGNSLRIRVGRRELADFLHSGRIQDTIHFASAPEAKLTYALEVSTADTTETHVRYLNQEVTVVLTPSQVLQWSKNDEVGVYTQVSLGTGALLDILVEKDFACLDRSDEDNLDTFANPNAGIKCQVS